jgi:hypothetical protein
MQFIPGQGLDRVIDELRRLGAPAPPERPEPAGPVSRMLWTGRFSIPAEGGMVAVADASAGGVGAATETMAPLTSPPGSEPEPAMRESAAIVPGPNPTFVSPAAK